VTRRPRHSAAPARAPGRGPTRSAHVASFEMRISVTEDGLHRVTGSVPIARQTIVANERGDSLRWERARCSTPQRRTRCVGAGTRRPSRSATTRTSRSAFVRTETASRRPLPRAGHPAGRSHALADRRGAAVRLRGVLRRRWADLESRGRSWFRRRRDRRQVAANCPSGRLVVWDRATRAALEPELEPSIGVAVDPTQGWQVRSGCGAGSRSRPPTTAYEVRNR
jgi:hypothetical protein